MFATSQSPVALTFHSSPLTAQAVISLLPLAAAATSRLPWQTVTADEGRGADTQTWTRSANCTPAELNLLIQECAKSPRRALGLNGSDNKSQKARQAFFAEIATKVSALGVAIRGPSATQKRFTEAFKGPHDHAKRLMRHGTPLEDALAQSVTGGAEYLQHLVPMLEMFVKADQFRVDILAPAVVAMHQVRDAPSTSSSASASATSRQDLQDAETLLDPGAPEGLCPPASPSSTGDPLYAEEQSLIGEGADEQPQDAVVFAALDDLSLSSSSSEGGVGTGSRSVPPATTHGGGDTAAQGSTRSAPSTSQGHRVRTPPPADLVVAATPGGEVDDDIGFISLRPHAQGPPAAAPFPKDMGALWPQMQRSLAEAGRANRENMQLLQEALVSETTAVQTSISSLSETMET